MTHPTPPPSPQAECAFSVMCGAVMVATLFGSYLATYQAGVARGFAEGMQGKRTRE